MNATLRRRIDALHSKLAPPPRSRLAIVDVPLEDDPPEEWERYRQEMAVDADIRVFVEYDEECLP